MRIAIAACAVWGAFFLAQANAMTYTLAPDLPAALMLNERGATDMHRLEMLGSSEQSAILSDLYPKISSDQESAIASLPAPHINTTRDVLSMSGMTIVEMAFESGASPFGAFANAVERDSNRRIPIGGTLPLMLTGMAAMAFARRRRSL